MFWKRGFRVVLVHLVVASYEPRERRAWCFVEQVEMGVPERFA
jgi:hypothetical protein